MDELVEYIRNHAERGTCRCGQCLDFPGVDIQPTGHTADVVFFKVSARNNHETGFPVDPEKLRHLISTAKSGEYCELDPWDGKEHSYIEVGCWLGDQGLALTLIGLGNVLGLWSIMTPKIMWPNASDSAIKQMAGMGCISIWPPTIGKA